MTPQICFLDIETAPALAAVWSLRSPECSAIWVERDTFLLSFAVLWVGETKIKTYALPDYPQYEQSKCNDKRLVEELHKVLSRADIIIAHNGDRFDIPRIKARMAVHGFPPPAPFKTIDTLKIARKFKFDSAKLDLLGGYLGVGHKLKHTGSHLWRSCIDGDPKAWKLMRKYNAQDVKLLAAVYAKLKAWGPHPDLRPYSPAGEQPTRDMPPCPTCESASVQKRGLNVARTRRYQRLHCQSCGTWFSGQVEKVA